MFKMVHRHRSASGSLPTSTEEERVRTYSEATVCTPAVAKFFIHQEHVQYLGKRF